MEMTNRQNADIELAESQKMKIALSPGKEQKEQQDEPASMNQVIFWLLFWMAKLVKSLFEYNILTVYLYIFVFAVLFVPHVSCKQYFCDYFEQSSFRQSGFQVSLCPFYPSYGL